VIITWTVKSTIYVAFTIFSRRQCRTVKK
jgi:hypothetical protein